MTDADSIRTLRVGPAVGGPLDGQELTSRCRKGVLLIDRPERRCWIYEWRDGAFHVRDAEPTPLLEEGDRNRFRAAEEPNYDVIAAPWSGAA